MFESVKRTVSAVAAAAVIAGAITIVHGANDQVVASAPLHSGKGDRIDIRATGANCSEQTWPYYEASCVKDARRPMSQAKPARTVTVDRVSVVR